MQTFLPLEDFRASAATLDRMRLGKQRVETMQIMKALSDPAYGWQNHPAVKMWRGHESWLMGYQSAICREWIGRGYRDTCFDKTLAVYLAGGWRESERPPWLGLQELHVSHQSNLVRKNEDYYSPQFPDVPGDIEYVWPVS